MKAATLNPISWSNDGLTACWLGHSTVLLNCHGTWVLTDPVLVDVIGIGLPVFGKVGLKRQAPLPMSPKRLPPIDVVLISHAHMDHLDYQSLELLKYKKETTVITPVNTSKLVERFGFRDVIELPNKKEVNVGAIRLRSFSVRHSGARTPFDVEYSSDKQVGTGYNAYLVTGSESCFFFMGDTGFTRRFKGKFDGQHVDLAIAPIGGYLPWGPAVHANPSQAMRMVIDIGATKMLPVHWGTFAIGTEKPADAIKALGKHAAGKQVGVVGSRAGETVVVR